MELSPLPRGRFERCSMSKPLKISFAIRDTYADALEFPECLLAFVSYRRSSTPEALVDNVLIRKRFRTAYRRWRWLLQRVRPPTEPSRARFWRATKGTFAMAVHPEWQGSGAEHLPPGKAEAELRKAGCGTVTLDTTESLNRAMVAFNEWFLVPSFGTPRSSIAILWNYVDVDAQLWATLP
jgi:GNAT superfamily N-acetyltransferase